VIRRLRPEFPVVRQGPYLSAARWRRAGARARSWSRSRSPSPTRPRNAPSPARVRGPSPTRPRWPIGRSSFRPCSTCRTVGADPAMVPRCDTARPWPPRPGADRPAATRGRSLRKQRPDHRPHLIRNHITRHTTSLPERPPKGVYQHALGDRASVAPQQTGFVRCCRGQRVDQIITQAANLGATTPTPNTGRPTQERKSDPVARAPRHHALRARRSRIQLADDGQT
jgi:hypothetical protein